MAVCQKSAGQHIILKYGTQVVFDGTAAVSAVAVGQREGGSAHYTKIGDAGGVRRHCSRVSGGCGSMRVRVSTLY